MPANSRPAKTTTPRSEWHAHRTSSRNGDAESYDAICRVIGLTLANDVDFAPPGAPYLIRQRLITVSKAPLGETSR